MTTIGIVGAGIAGLHLSHYLLKHGISVTLYTDRTPDEMRAARLAATTGFLGTSRIRDAELDLNHWDRPENDTAIFRLQVAGDPPLVFKGTNNLPTMFIDMRLYLPRALEDFAGRGGKVVVGPSRAEDVARLAEGHSLMVVATGRGGLAELFPRIPERSPFQEAPRRLLGGLFRGVHRRIPNVFGYNFMPGLGELYDLPFVTKDGLETVLLFEIIPGGPLEPLLSLRYEEDPSAFDAAILAAVREHAPDTYATIDPAAFGLKGPLDLVSGAVVPTARRGFIPLAGGRFAMAIGDSFVSMDPITGQGGNAAARAAWILGELVTEQARAGGRFDEAFCARAEERLWEAIRSAYEWTNATLLPPPPHVIGLLVAAAQNQALADAFMSNFNYADRQWAVLSSPEATSAFIARAGAAA